MKKSIVLTSLAISAVCTAQAQVQSQPQEFARVLSSTPVVQQVAVPRQVCTQQPIAYEQPNSGAGGIMGAIAGGAVGSQIGSGSGRGVATVLGVIGGAVLGNRVEGSGTQVQNYQQCSTQTFYENRAVAYNVTYEYAGRQYTVQMPSDPGPTVRLQITPVVGAPMPPAEPATVMPAYPAPGYAPVPAPTFAPAPVVIYPSPIQQAYVGQGPVFAPGYYQRPYYHRPYPPVTLHLGFVHRSGHHHGHRQHWR